MLSDLHQVLLCCGFQYIKAQHIPEGTPLRAIDHSNGFYVKNYDTSEGIFNIALSLPIDPHTKLPRAYILKKPEHLNNILLPHVNLGWYLCYVQEMEADWDANDLHGVYSQVDGQIQRTLNASISSVMFGSPDDQEMEGEFSSYWLPSEHLYLLSEVEEQRTLQCYRLTNTEREDKPTGVSNAELVAFTNDDERDFNRWIKQRCLTKSSGRSTLTSYFKIKPSRLAGVAWPPQSLRELLKWLMEVDHGACNRLLNYFVANPVKRHVLLLDVLHQDLIGIYIEIDIAAVGLNHYPKKNNRKKNNGRSINYKTLTACLSAKRSSHKFTRIGVTRADKKTVISRNRRRSVTGDLSSKRIALIGCGTIGGYLSGLLLRSGAGCGQGNFDLFDNDNFGPQNFGRHSLSTQDFGQNKAIALAETLKHSTHFNTKIMGYPSQFLVTPELLKKYDIVIDTTGRPPVAKRLAHVVRSIPPNSRPKLVHGFNDGNGRSSKVLIDNGEGCYGCLLNDHAFYKDGLDMRFNKLNSKEDRVVSCGNTFTPYDAAVSVITAAMTQEAVLSILEPSLNWTYSEHMFDGSRSRKSRILQRKHNCPICHD
nr:E2/UBC family protein [Plesiomonas shigelloides]